MDPQLEQIAAYLRGQKLATRHDDPRQWADYLDTVIQPQLKELETLKAAKSKKVAA